MRGRLRPLAVPEECPQGVADVITACLQVGTPAEPFRQYPSGSVLPQYPFGSTLYCWPACAYRRRPCCVALQPRRGPPFCLVSPPGSCPHTLASCTAHCGPPPPPLAHARAQADPSQRPSAREVYRLLVACPPLGVGDLSESSLSAAISSRGSRGNGNGSPLARALSGHGANRAQEEGRPGEPEPRIWTWLRGIPGIGSAVNGSGSGASGGAGSQHESPEPAPPLADAALGSGGGVHSSQGQGLSWSSRLSSLPGRVSPALQQMVSQVGGLVAALPLRRRSLCLSPPHPMADHAMQGAAFFLILREKWERSRTQMGHQAGQGWCRTGGGAGGLPGTAGLAQHTDSAGLVPQVKERVRQVSRHARSKRATPAQAPAT